MTPILLAAFISLCTLPADEQTLLVHLRVGPVDEQCFYDFDLTNILGILQSSELLVILGCAVGARLHKLLDYRLVAHRSFQNESGRRRFDPIISIMSSKEVCLYEVLASSLWCCCTGAAYMMANQ